jgi:uncharacterized repeat protein (TIGR01451 family)
VLTSTITNGAATTATGVTISSTFPDTDAREEITGVTGCDSTGLNIDICTVPDIPAGGTAVVTWRYAPTAYGIDRHHQVAASASPASSDEADFDVRVKTPPGWVDWKVTVTPSVGMGGLRARHQVLVTNLGPATATNVTLTEQLDVGEQVVATSLGAGCSGGIVSPLQCSLGTLAPRTSFILVVDTKLPANPSGFFHVANVGTDTPSVNHSHMSGSGPAVLPWRYWMCTCVTTFEDGYELPGGFTVLPDETVQVTDGSVIRRDGVLVRADGKLVLADGIITTQPAFPPAAPAGVVAAAGDGMATVAFQQPASAFPITTYTVRTEPGGYVFRGQSSPITAVGLANGTSYTFTVTAWSGAGPGSPSAASNPVTPLPAPPPPTGVTAAGGDTQATVSFTPTAAGDGPPILHYTATAFPSGRVAHGVGSPITVTGLKNGASYTLSVSATSAIGTGLDSADSNSVVPAVSSRPHPDPPPEAPRAPTPVPPPNAAPRPVVPGP